MAEKNPSKTLNRAVIKVNSLTCGACFSNITAGLETLEGYSGMGTNLIRKLIAVDFTVPLTKEPIAEKLEKIGYPGQVKYVDSITEKESFAYLEARRGRFNFAGGGCGGCPGASNGSRVLPQEKAPEGSCCPAPANTRQIRIKDGECFF